MCILIHSVHTTTNQYHCGGHIYKIEVNSSWAASFGFNFSSSSCNTVLQSYVCPPASTLPATHGYYSLDLLVHLRFFSVFPNTWIVKNWINSPPSVRCRSIALWVISLSLNIICNSALFPVLSAHTQLPFSFLLLQFCLFRNIIWMRLEYRRVHLSFILKRVHLELLRVVTCVDSCFSLVDEYWCICFSMFLILVIPCQSDANICICVHVWASVLGSLS